MPVDWPDFTRRMRRRSAMYFEPDVFLTFPAVQTHLFASYEGPTSLDACMASYESCRASQRSVNPDPGERPPPEEDLPLLTDDWHVEELDTGSATRAECVELYHDIRALCDAGSAPLPHTSRDILAMTRSFPGSERAITAELIKVPNLTAEAKDLAPEHHGLQTRLEKSTNDLSSIHQGGVRRCRSRV